MKIEDLKKITNSIKEKLGDEQSSIIADDLVTIISDNNSMNELINQKDKELEESEKQKEMLMKTNMNLLQQVGFTDKQDETEETEDRKMKYDFSSAFDERGNFKR